ncbi:ABC transporter permease [Paludibaculum fermentans]|uniref:ABC transporter permease n=1 Tax=Paludibaculum fermentans TaxID=1473598 RepID=UPI003EC09775
MSGWLRGWLAETHGARFELVRHFLPRFFDSDLMAVTGDWSRTAAGALAILASSWILLFVTLLFKYRQLAETRQLARIPLEVTADLNALTCLAVCLTTLLVAALWQSFYPSLRDCLALAGRPVSFADIFVAKFSAVLLVYGLFVLLLTLPAAAVLSLVTGAAVGSSFSFMASACTVAFFAPVALQGALLNVMPARIFERLMIWLQAALAATAIAGFPLAAGAAGAILGALRFSGRDLQLAAAAAPVLAVLIYLISFQRYRRLLLEAPTSKTPGPFDLLSRFLELLVPDPRAQAALFFICKTLYRSRIHRLAAIVYAAVAVAWTVKSAADVADASGSDKGMGGMVLTACALTLVLFLLAGLRHLFSLPADLRSNWIFQLTEREGRRAWMNAVERFVLACVAVPIAIGSMTFLVRSEGLFTAVAWPVVMGLLAAAVFEFLFRDWRKMPFTCSYLPSKRPLILTCAICLSVALLLVPITWIVYHSAVNPFGFLTFLSIEVVVWWSLRKARLSRWGLLALRYEERLDPELEAFSMSGEGTSQAQEQFHLEWADYLRGGAAVPIVRELAEGETRASRLLEWLGDLPRDLRFGLRSMGRSPGFALAAVLTLSLGLGLNAAFFTVFNAFLLKPLAVRDPASLVSFGFETRQGSEVHLGLRDIESVAQHVTAFSEVAVSTVEGTGLDGQAARAGLVSGNYFSLLGATTALGHSFQAGEHDAVLVLTHTAWKSRFGGDPAVLGRRLAVNGIPFEVIGVTVPEFTGAPVGTVEVADPKLARYGVGAPDFWIPIEAWNRVSGLPEVPARGVVGRLRPGMSTQQAQAILTAYVRRLTADRPEWLHVSRASLDELDIPVTWTALTYSLPLLIAFGLTMLIPCANAANLILSRAMARQREFGVRLSLGAGRGRLVRQLLTESLITALAASAAGLVLARVALHFLLQLIYATAPPTILFRMRIPDMVLDGHVFFYMLLVSILTTVLFALAPAAQATRLAVASALRGEVAGLRASRLRDVLVVGQISACVMLLVTASVLLRGVRQMTQIERGYTAAGVFGIANQGLDDARALLEILGREPWLETVAVMGRPLNDLDSIQVRDAGRSGSQRVYMNRVSSEGFRLLRMSIVRGRGYTQQEAENRAPVAVVSEMAARQLWPGEDPLGKTILIEHEQSDNVRLPPFQQATVIGISGDFVSKVRDAGARACIHFPDVLRTGTMVVVRGRGPADETRRQLATALGRAPGSTHGARVVALQETLDWETYPQQAASWLSGLLGLLALLLSVSGLYGVMSYLVSQRTREIGIRMALGATTGQVAFFILRYSTRMAAAGLLCGAILAAGALRYAASEWDLAIRLDDFAAYSASMGLMILAILLASLGPADRACRVDPQEVLRLE